MKVTFVALGSEQLSVSLLAALARRDGHQVGLAFSAALFDDRYFGIPALARWVDDRAAAVAAVVEQRPDVLACSVLTGSYQWMLGIAREAKQRLPALKVAFGGVHPSALPERVLAREEVDCVCIGEGDEAFPAWLRALERGGPTSPIPNLAFKGREGQTVFGPRAAFIQDLDRLPFFEKTLWEDHLRVVDPYLTMASRGCPYRCTFCFNSFFAELPGRGSGRYVRQRGVEHMMGELVAAKRRYGRLRFIDFQDDVFTVDKEWLRPFLARYRREIGAPFRCLVHPRYVDADIARWLAEAGCVWVQMGVQTIDDEFKSRTLKRHETMTHVSRAIDALRRQRLHVQVDHILGLPGEPEDAQERARQIYAAHAPSRVSTFWATYFPGTVMLREAVASGIVSEADAEAFNDGYLPLMRNAVALVAGAERERDFRAYDLIFRLLPLLPARWRGRIGPRVFRKLPPAVTQALAYAADMLAGLGLDRYEERAYLRHYLHHLAKFARRRLGFSLAPATLRPVGADVVLAGC